ncbi:unnamed protein product, partial [Effrenium voratum]
RQAGGELRSSPQHGRLHPPHWTHGTERQGRGRVLDHGSRPRRDGHGGQGDQRL